MVWRRVRDSCPNRIGGADRRVRASVIQQTRGMWNICKHADSAVRASDDVGNTLGHLNVTIHG
jgi:hypothetical protein